MKTTSAEIRPDAPTRSPLLPESEHHAWVTARATSPPSQPTFDSLLEALNALGAIPSVTAPGVRLLPLVRWLEAAWPLPYVAPEDRERELARVTRVLLLQEALESHPPWAAAYGAAVYDLLAGRSIRPFLTRTGLAASDSFLENAVALVVTRLVPSAPRPTDLGEFLLGILSTPASMAWLDMTDPKAIAGLVLPAWEHAEKHGLPDPGSLWHARCVDALALLAVRVAALGSVDAMIERGTRANQEGRVFRYLGREIEASAAAVARDRTVLYGDAIRMVQIRCAIDACREELRAVEATLDTQGVDVGLVFRLDRIRQALDRIDSLLLLLGEETPAPASVMAIVAHLVRRARADQSAQELLGTNLRHLAQKLVESAGQAGDHYITRTPRQYAGLFLSACGGGALTALTTAGKFGVVAMRAAPLGEGVLMSINYAGSFLAMQAMGFTLATKQPTMTAATLARAWQDNASGSVDALVEQTASIARSQFAAALGNVAAVIPTAMLFHFGWLQLAGKPMLDATTAGYVTASLHPLTSGTIPFAMLTGVILWMASLCGGWLLNWVNSRRMGEAIRHHRLGTRLLGQARMDRIAQAIPAHTAGVGVNVSLGVMLGMLPVFAVFAGLPLDVRHVTLSAGSLTFAQMTLADTSVGPEPVLWAWAGVGVIGLLNFGVGFVLSLAVAARASGRGGRPLGPLMRAASSALLRSPMRFVFPPRTPAAALAPGAPPPVP